MTDSLPCILEPGARKWLAHCRALLRLMHDKGRLLSVNPDRPLTVLSRPLSCVVLLAHDKVVDPVPLFTCAHRPTSWATFLCRTPRYSAHNKRLFAEKIVAERPLSCAGAKNAGQSVSCFFRPFAVRWWCATKRRIPVVIYESQT